VDVKEAFEEAAFAPVDYMAKGRILLKFTTGVREDGASMKRKAAVLLLTAWGA